MNRTEMPMAMSAGDRSYAEICNAWQAAKVVCKVVADGSGLGIEMQ